MVKMTQAGIRHTPQAFARDSIGTLPRRAAF